MLGHHRGGFEVVLEIEVLEAAQHRASWGFVDNLLGPVIEGQRAILAAVDHM